MGTVKDKNHKMRFGDWLVSHGLISNRKLAEALGEQSSKGGRLGEVLLRLNMITKTDLVQSLSEFFSIDYISLEDLGQLDLHVARKVPENIAKRFGLIAVNKSNDKIVVAMSDLLNIVAIDTISHMLGSQLKPVLASIDDLTRAFEHIYHGSDMAEQRLRDLVEVEIGEEGDVVISEEDLTVADISREVDANDAPVIRFVDLLLNQAVSSRASDIHVEPQEDGMKIRMRIDGVLGKMVPPARKMQNAVVTRIKILSGMDIAERRLPQDGRFKIKAPGREIDVRVSAIPTIYGEKVVMRILDKLAVDHNIEHLGFDPVMLEKFKYILSQPHGIIIVTGPTGSGKSTTLYSSLNYLQDPRLNIVTVEDPVEYRLKGVNQIQVKPDINLDFALSLRAILRQDPDIILIGEIRDKETMDIAIKASLTGHLVLTTFHTNDAPSAISRLVYMGLEPYLLASTLNLIIAQRLVRRICEKCKEPVTIGNDMLSRLRLEPSRLEGVTFYEGKGCRHCKNTGYFGRLPVFEFLVVDRDIREMLVSGASEAQIRAKSREKGCTGLFEEGVKKILEGVTTVEEVLSVTYDFEV